MVNGAFGAPCCLVEAEACYEDFLEDAEHNLEMAYLARVLPEACQNNALSYEILQDILENSCKICIFFSSRVRKRFFFSVERILDVELNILSLH